MNPRVYPLKDLKLNLNFEETFFFYRKRQFLWKNSNTFHSSFKIKWKRLEVTFEKELETYIINVYVVYPSHILSVKPQKFHLKIKLQDLHVEN